MPFTALPGGSGVGGSYQVGDLWRPDIEATRTKENFDDLNSRVSDVEDALIADGSIQTAEIFMTSGEIFALRTVPKTLVVAPGSGRTIEFLGGLLFIGSGSLAYVESGANLAVRFMNSGGTIVSEDIETTGFIDQTSDLMTQVLPRHGSIAPKTFCENQPLILHNIGPANYTSGNRVLRFKFGYRIWTTQW